MQWHREERRVVWAERDDRGFVVAEKEERVRVGSLCWEEYSYGGGFGDKGRESWCWYDVEDMLEGKRTGGEKDQLGAVKRRRETVEGWG